jgi:hypothetical protein
MTPHNDPGYNYLSFLRAGMSQSGSHQPGNDINTYFGPLLEDLKVLCYKCGVEVWEEYKREYFQRQANLFVTVSNSPVACNL